MKIQYASDLHLEFAQNSKFLAENPFQVVGDVLVLAGDIGYLGTDMYTAHPFWDWASANYQQVIVIPGNHEFYQFFDIAELHDGWQLAIRENVTCYYNAVIPLSEDVDLIATTLWANIPAYDAFYTERSVSDFYRIRCNKMRLTWEMFNQEHERYVAFLKKSVAESKAKHIIVASHHVPSFALMADEFKGSNINGAFTSELGNYIAHSPIAYWIYGHSHRNIDALIGDTHCVSNQLGYVSHGENSSFDSGKYICI